MLEERSGSGDDAGLMDVKTQRMYKDNFERACLYMFEMIKKYGAQIKMEVENE